MRKVPVEIAFSDARGAIADLVVEPLDSATRIYTAKGAIRGNHYHRDTHQWTYVIDGALQIVTMDAGKREEGTLTAGELLYTPPHEQHAWKALEDTTVLVLTRGPRSGMNYEQDTYRLEGNRKLYMSTLSEIRDGWDQAAEQDAMGHILTTGTAWDQAEFFRTGLVEIDAALERADFLEHRGRGRKLALDFGCGIGRLTQALAVHYDLVIGVDISPAMLTQARELNLHRDRVAYLEQIPVGGYDLIYSNLVLQHMPRELAHEHIRRFIRLLAPDGIAIFMIPEGPDYTHPTPCLSMWGTPPEDVKQIVLAAGGRIVDMDTVPGPVSRWAPWRYTATRAPAPATAAAPAPRTRSDTRADTAAPEA